MVDDDQPRPSIEVRDHAGWQAATALVRWTDFVAAGRTGAVRCRRSCGLLPWCVVPAARRPTLAPDTRHTGSMSGERDHWDRVYAAHARDAVSWFEPLPRS